MSKFTAGNLSCHYGVVGHTANAASATVRFVAHGHAAVAVFAPSFSPGVPNNRVLLASGSSETNTHDCVIDFVVARTIEHTTPVENEMISSSDCNRDGMLSHCVLESRDIVTFNACRGAPAA